jgi:hypothetical protein
MFVKRNTSRAGGKTYQSILLVQGKRVPVSHGAPGRPRKNLAKKTKVIHQTLANLSRLPVDLISIIEGFCVNPEPTLPAASGTTSPAAPPPISSGACYGVIAALHALATKIGLPAALGTSRQGSLILFLIYARIAMQGSRLGAVRWAEDHAVAEALGLGSFDEDDLYAALDWLEERHAEVECALAKGKVTAGAVFLYDVTSSYFEGQHNELAAAGYNRDGKRYKKQVVAGLLTDATGDPLSIELYKGNTADPTTFGDTIERLRERFGARDLEIVLVGDRGMIKSTGKAQLKAAGYRYVSALTDPQIRKLLSEKTITMELFDETPVEVQIGGRRLILRCNPATRERERQRRESQWKKVQAKIQARNAAVATKPRASAEASLRQAQAWIKGYQLHRYIQLRLEGRTLCWSEDSAQRAKVEQLDGCYVLESDLSSGAATTGEVHQRYMDLMQVERDFRTIKTGALELRPFFLRKEGRTRGHALVTMLTLKLYRALDQRVAPLGLTVADAVERLGGVRLVSLGTTGFWRLPDSYASPQAEIIAALPTMSAPMLSPKIRPKRRLTGLRKYRQIK